MKANPMVVVTVLVFTLAVLSGCGDGANRFDELSTISMTVSSDVVQSNSDVTVNSSTGNSSSENKKEDEYIDESTPEGLYRRNGSGEVVLFSIAGEKLRPITQAYAPEKKLPLDTLQQIAWEYIRDKVPIDQYELYFAEDAGDTASFGWGRVREGLKTAEMAVVIVEYEGTICSFFSAHVNRFADRELPVINEQVLASQLDEQVRRTLGEVSYEEDPEKRMWILMEDDTVGMAMMVTYAIPDGDGETEEYEFHIPLE